MERVGADDAPRTSEGEEEGEVATDGTVDAPPAEDGRRRVRETGQRSVGDRSDGKRGEGLNRRREVFERKENRRENEGETTVGRN